MLDNSQIYIKKFPSEEYGTQEIAAAIVEIGEALGWAEKGRGAFGKIVKEGAKVVVKPNFVLHQNRDSSGGIVPLITHPEIVKAVVAEVLKANPKRVSVGDAPIQSCDFGELLRLTKMDEWAEDLKKSDARFGGIIDFRRTTCVYSEGVRYAEENKRSLEDFLLFNLGKDSMLEPITDDKKSFRVTCYDPRLMAKTHSRENHQYLLAREIIEADVVINLPKLKTHKKAGITNALKNLVGINGNKEFLPHHRIGAPEEGGDCYPQTDYVKKAWEFIADQQNMTASPVKGKALATVNLQLERLMRLQGDEVGVEGAWSGNETVARMTLDLNRLLLYGKIDATLDAEERVQRRVVHISDAIVGGHDDGPLSPKPLPLKMLIAGENASAVDFVGAILLGYEPEKIPLLRSAFDEFKWKIAAFKSSDIKVTGDLRFENLSDFANENRILYPSGWRDAAKKKS